jgi:hypothetical protein
MTFERVDSEKNPIWSFWREGLILLPFFLFLSRESGENPFLQGYRYRGLCMQQPDNRPSSPIHKSAAFLSFLLLCVCQRTLVHIE